MNELTWNKYGLIIYLVKELQKVSPQIGKTVIQKMVYILTELFNVPTGYEFSLYTYGPYSSELAEDISFVAALDGIKVKSSKKFGYEIKVGSRSREIIKEAESFIKDYMSNIKQAVEAFGSLTARELELRSTLIYIAVNESNLSKDGIIKKFKVLKPYFTYEEIEKALNDLIEKKFIKLECQR
ncbi:hypothetical protein [Carboxydothermus pertinax]|uniref:Antitoxin SocA-like Panacea domain-containing protein n=1 Tax=Carboxydothermus pertinax TaxID=870242 RepID=A0A1L8CWV5_9THEO|nr:hypothetical protein [Carboxydothermus pertinax]GAV23387.1 hypothetical protein cpu_18970 [Carboxydothermus pertinax]